MNVATVDVRLPEGTTEEAIKKLGLTPARENIVLRVFNGETLEEIHETVQGRDIADLKTIVGDAILALHSKITGNGAHEQSGAPVESGAVGGVAPGATGNGVGEGDGPEGDENQKLKLSEVTTSKLISFGFSETEAQMVFLRIREMSQAQICEELGLKTGEVSIALARGISKLRSCGKVDLTGSPFEKSRKDASAGKATRKRFPKCPQKKFDKINFTEEERKVAELKLAKHNDAEIAHQLGIKRKRVKELLASAAEKILKGEEITVPPVPPPAKPVKRVRTKAVVAEGVEVAKRTEKAAVPGTISDSDFVEAEAVRDFAAKLLEAEAMKKQIQAEAFETFATRIGGMDPKLVMSRAMEFLLPYVASFLPGQGENLSLARFRKPREAKDASDEGVG